MKTKVFAIAVAGAATLYGLPAVAQTITDGTGYTAGIGPNGELYDSDSGVGLENPDGDDYIQPGTPRDSWGITSSAGSAFADYRSFGTSGISGTTSTFGANTASLLSTTVFGLSVEHVFNFFAPNILSVQETVTNTSGATISDIIFRRNVDLDIPPTLFNENVTGPIGANASVVANSYYGFENPNPAVAYDFPCGVSCNENGDLGAGIDLGLGSLGSGDSITFAYYYGINQPGQTLDQLFTQGTGLGLSYLIGAQSRENGDFPALGARSAFLGVSNIGTIAGPGVGAVPEPGTWALMLLGFGFAGAAMRRRKKAVHGPARVTYA